MSTILTPRRSFLFTPANRPALFEKALVSGADIVCIDLEDAVAADQKDASRPDAYNFLKAKGDTSPERIVRINSPRTEIGQRDLNALLEADLKCGIIMIPKIDSAEELLYVDNLFQEASSSLKLALLIETPLGVENVYDIFTATPRLDLVMLGGVDLSAELGTRVAPEPLAYARSRMVYAARHAKVDVFDMPCLKFKDLNTVKAEADLARHLGFTGKAVIHPSNIPIVNETFTPTPEEIQEARRILEAYQNSTTGVAVIDGALVEKPVVRAMELIIARAEASKLNQ
jgi:citrate lyase subunit beta/citryl-CoA lyase/(S)-citramalyl-CoA lyase